MSKRGASPFEEEGGLCSHPGKKRDWDVREMQRVTITIDRRIEPGRESRGPIRRSVSCPERIVIVRKPGEGSRPIFDRVELYQNAKDRSTCLTDCIRCRKTVKVEDDCRRDRRRRSSSSSSRRSPDRSHRSKERTPVDEKAVSSSSSSQRNPSPGHKNVTTEDDRSRTRASGTFDNSQRNARTHSATREVVLRESSSNNNNNNTTRETFREIIVPVMSQPRPGPAHPVPLPGGQLPGPARYCILPPQRMPPPMRPPPPFGHPPFMYPLPPVMRPRLRHRPPLYHG